MSLRRGSLLLLAPIVLAAVGCTDDAEVSPAFYGFYTRIESGEPWEEEARFFTGDRADLVVRLGASRLVFARSTSYLPRWETPQGSWSLDELVPRSGDGTRTMPDRI